MKHENQCLWLIFYLFQGDSETHAAVTQAPIGEAVSACNNNINCT